MYSECPRGYLSTTVSTSWVRSPACAGGCGAAVAVGSVPLSAAGESAARQSSAGMRPIGLVCTWGTRSTWMGHSDRLSGVTLKWVVTWNTVRIWATLGHSASGYPSRPEYPNRHGRDAHPTWCPPGGSGVPHQRWAAVTVCRRERYAKEKLAPTCRAVKGSELPCGLLGVPAWVLTPGTLSTHAGVTEGALPAHTTRRGRVRAHGRYLLEAMPPTSRPRQRRTAQRASSSPPKARKLLSRGSCSPP
jgi:hypothetical protein